MPHAGTLGPPAQISVFLPYKLPSINYGDTLDDNLTDINVVALFRVRFTPNLDSESENAVRSKTSYVGITREVIESKRPALAGTLKSTVKASVLRHSVHSVVRRARLVSQKTSYDGITREVIESKGPMCEGSVESLLETRILQSSTALPCAAQTHGSEKRRTTE